MKWTVLIASLVAAVSSFSTEPVLANDVADVVRARANARAGGGTSGHDAWVLKRHGRLSGSGGSTHRYLAKKKAAKKRAFLAAKARKVAAAKRRALIAAKKKKAAERRAYLLAKKKKKAKLAAIAAEKKAKTQKLAAVEQAKADAEQKESSFVATPSTAALMTSQDRTPETVDAKPEPNTNVAVVEPNQEAVAVKETATTDQNVGNKGDNSEENCKRFLPAIGLTVSVGC